MSKTTGALNLIKQAASPKKAAKVIAADAAHSGDTALPLVLPRARMTPEFIDAQADRVARQMLGEHVRKPGKTDNLAGRSLKESQRLKQLNYKLSPTGTVAEEGVYVPRKGDVKVAFPGDQTVSNKILEEIEGFPIDSHQQGGAYYGLGQKHLPEPEFWKSTETPAQNVQGKVDRVAQEFEPERVIGSHLAMGQTSNNFAMHFADANLRSIDWSKVKPKDINEFDKIIARGYYDQVAKEWVQFPHWPGLANPDAAFMAMVDDSKMRKWFNNRMKVPAITKKLGLPSALDTQYAITEPRIRDMEINMTGLMTGELKPGALVEAAGAPHNTYSHRILGEAIGPQEVLTPFVIGFPDAAQHIATTKRPADFTGTIQKVFPHQVVDEQYLDEYNRYRERIKKLTGQKQGGLAHFGRGGNVAAQKKKSSMEDITTPLTHLGDMLGGALRGMTKTSMGFPGDIEGFGREAINYGLRSAPKNKPYLEQGYQAPQISEETILHSSKDADKLLPKVVPANDKSRQHTAEIGESLGEWGALPGTTAAYKGAYRAVKSLPKALKHGAVEFAKASGQPATKVIKGKGGNWLANHPDEMLKNLRQRTAVGSDPAEVLKELKAKWTPQEIERVASTNPQLENIRVSIPHQIEHLEKQVAINRWIDGNLKNYVKNEMGTPNDPVRAVIEKRAQDVEELRLKNESKLARMDEKIAKAEEAATTDKDREKIANMKRARNEQAYEMAIEIQLAEQHTSHLTTTTSDNFGDWIPDSLGPKRQAEGFPKKGVATSRSAKAWETIADLSIDPDTVGSIKNEAGKFDLPRAKRIMAQNPWMEKLQGDQSVFSGRTAPFENANFNHVLDVLQEDIARGRLRIDQLNKVSVEQAVARAAEYDKEAARAMAKANAKNLSDLEIHTEYPSGYKWVRLNKPGQFSAESDAMGHSVRGYEPPKDHPDWIEGSGDSGRPFYGYGGWEAIKRGQAEVYSLLDPFNNPHVTVEVGTASPKEAALKAMPEDVQRAFHKRIDDWMDGLDYVPSTGEITEKTKQLFREFKIPISKEINQIKGKGNARPVEKYDPYTQDFVKQSTWERVGDLENTGLFNVNKDFLGGLSDFMPQAEDIKHLKKQQRMEALARAVDAGDLPESGYVTREEWEAAIRKHGQPTIGEADDELLRQLQPPGEGMKAGGAVQKHFSKTKEQLEQEFKHYAGGGKVVRGMKMLGEAFHNPDAVVNSARGASKFTEPAPKTMNIIKEKGGNWLTGKTSNSFEDRLKRMTPYYDQKSAIATQKAKIASMENSGTSSQRTLANAKANLTELETEQAVNNWVTQNLGNYIKKEMATPSDPVRLMLEKRAQEIEAQFKIDMDRAKRIRARAEIEPDPDRKANMLRQADREEEMAKSEKELQMDNALHMPKDTFNIDEGELKDLMQYRKEEGFAPKGVAKSEPAQIWERAADDAIFTRKANDLQKQKDAYDAYKVIELEYLSLSDQIKREYAAVIRKKIQDTGAQFSDKDLQHIIDNMPLHDKAKAVGKEYEYTALQRSFFDARNKSSSGLLAMAEENPWVEKLGPNEKLYTAQIGSLELDHVIDVLKQDVAAGRIRPEQLNKLSVDQAIKRTAEFNVQQARKMRETAIKNMEGFPTHKEYPEGYKWIELKKPDELTDIPPTHELEPYESKVHGGTAYRVINKETGMRGEGYKTPEQAKKAFLKEHAEERLAEALKYEGDTMGHCVGGYCPDVLSGDTRIYSLRDKRGEPHVTIEVQPTYRDRGFVGDQRPVGDEYYELQNKYVEGQRNGTISPELTFAEWWRSTKGIPEAEKLPPTIRQIKGKQNARPKDSYVSFADDFVKSGDWTDVFDLHHTNLVKIDPASDMANKLRQAGRPVPKFVSQDELNSLSKWYQGGGDLPEGFAKGGAVHVYDDNPFEHMGFEIAGKDKKKKSHDEEMDDMHNAILKYVEDHIAPLEAQIHRNHNMPTEHETVIISQFSNNFAPRKKSFGGSINTRM